MGDGSEAMIDVESVSPHRSVSQLNSYLDCSEAYRLQRVAKAPQRPAAWFESGTATHFAIEEYERSGRRESVDSLASLAEAEYDRIISDKLESEPDLSRWLTGGRKKADKDISDRRGALRGHIGNYVEYAEAHADEWQILRINDDPAVEMEFSVDFGGVNVYGFIDQIRIHSDGRVEPVDLKAGSRTPSSTLQLGVYSQVIQQNMGLDSPPALGVYFMTKDASNREYDMGMWSREVLDSMFHEFDRAEKSGVYIPRPGDQCRVCTVQDSCRIMGNPVSISENMLFERMTSNERSG